MIMTLHYDNDQNTQLLTCCELTLHAIQLSLTPLSNSKCQLVSCKQIVTNTKHINIRKIRVNHVYTVINIKHFIYSVYRLLYAL